MFRQLLCIAALLLLATNIHAQDDRLDGITFDEVPLKEEVVPYFAVGVGPVFNFMFPNLIEVNERATSLGLPEFSSPMIISGADIFTAIGVVRDVRIGFQWIGGNSQTSKEMTVAGVDVERTMKYSIFLRGMYVDYAYVPFKSFAILPGVGFGWGSQDLETFQAPKARSWTDFGGSNGLVTSPDAYSHLERNFIHIAPHLNLEYAITPYLNLRAAAAYHLQVSSGDWIGTRTSTVSGVPDAININSLSVQVGLFIGLFN